MVCHFMGIFLKISYFQIKILKLKLTSVPLQPGRPDSPFKPTKVDCTIMSFFDFESINKSLFGDFNVNVFWILENNAGVYV